MLASVWKVHATDFLNALPKRGAVERVNSQVRENLDAMFSSR